MGESEGLCASGIESVCMHFGSSFMFSDCLSAGAVSCWLLVPIHTPSEEKERKLLLIQSENSKNLILFAKLYILLHIYCTDLNIVNLKRKCLC